MAWSSLCYVEFLSLIRYKIIQLHEESENQWEISDKWTGVSKNGVQKIIARLKENGTPLSIMWELVENQNDHHQEDSTLASDVKKSTGVLVNCEKTTQFYGSERMLWGNV